MSSFQLLWESSPAVNYLEEERNILFLKKYTWQNIWTQVFYLKTSFTVQGRRINIYNTFKNLKIGGLRWTKDSAENNDKGPQGEQQSCHLYPPFPNGSIMASVLSKLLKAVKPEMQSLQSPPKAPLWRPQLAGMSLQRALDTVRSQTTDFLIQKISQREKKAW